MGQTKKRPLDDDKSGECHNINTKTFKITHEPTTANPKSTKYVIGLSNLCDDVVLDIFKYLPHDSLVNMSQVHPSLSRISDDWTLWKHVRFDNFMKSMEDTYINYLKESTTHIDIECYGNPSYDSSVSHKFITRLVKKCPELTHLALCKQIIDSSEINVKMLNRKLRSLTIDDTIIENLPDNLSYLGGLSITCPDLEEIRITFNDWLMPICLFQLALLKNLTYLSLRGCHNIKDYVIYVHIISFTGFECLQTLDLRLTPIGDHELVCFQRLKNLKHVLLESPSYIDHDIDATITDDGVSGFYYNQYMLDLYIQTFIINSDIERYLRRANERTVEVNKCKIEKLVVRNYPKITDVFLKNAAQKCPLLQYLDVTGTSCTLDEIEKYKAQNPNVNIMY